MKKRIISLLLAITLISTLLCTCASALEYGEEWAGATSRPTTTYTDVNSGHWAYDSIMRVSEKGWFNGYPDGRFLPNGKITRAEALKVFVEFLSLEVVPVPTTSYYDVNASKWYAPYIEAGKDLFPTRATIQGKIPFQPDMPVTREDTIYALVKALGYDVGVSVVDESVLNMFSDQNSISRNIKPYVAIALENELVAGYEDGTIRAQNSLTRAEFATLLYRATFVGFNDSYTAKISNVTVTPASPIELEVGNTSSLSARAEYTDGSNQPYTDIKAYDASNNGVISLSGNTITALKEGTSTIKFNDSYLKNTAIVVVVKKPSDAPKLLITDYPETTFESSTTISGTVSDKNITDLNLVCNNKDVSVYSDGSFETTVSLSTGNNNITFVATNKYGVSTKKTIVIRYDKAEDTDISDDSSSSDRTATINFLELETQLDTSWADDEYIFTYMVVSSEPISEYGIVCYDASTGKEIEYLDKQRCEGNFAAQTYHSYWACHGGIYEDSVYGLELGHKYKWYAYAICNGKQYTSSEREFTFTTDGTKFSEYWD